MFVKFWKICCKVSVKLTWNFLKLCAYLRFRWYFSNMSEKFPLIYRISSIFSYIFQIFRRLVVAFDQLSTSYPPSSHDDLILGFLYITEVLHNFSWGSYRAGFHRNYGQIDSLRYFMFKTNSCVYLDSLTHIFFLFWRGILFYYI